MKRFVSLLLLCFAVAGCGIFTTPPPPEEATRADLLREQLASFEIGYQEALRTLITYRKAGQLTQDEIERVDDFIAEYGRARSVAKGFLDVGEILEAEQSAVQVLEALQALRNLVAQHTSSLPIPQLEYG